MGREEQFIGWSFDQLERGRNEIGTKGRLQ